MDSLNKTSSITTLQELFIKNKGIKSGRPTKNDRQFIRRYDLWRQEEVNLFSVIIEKLIRSDTSLVRYLEHVECRTQETGAKAFGFKVLSHHLTQRPKLQDNLLQRGYSALYLTRNLPRQVISGIVAKKRGKYNAHENENYQNDSEFLIDINAFISLIEEEQKHQCKDLNLIHSLGFAHKEITYEGFMSNRDQFFLDIFNFLGLEPENAPDSSYMIMIENLRDTITNYDQIRNTTEKLGLTLG